MLVSGGKLLAISKVKTDGVTVSGDGVTEAIGIKNADKGNDTYSVEAGNDYIKVGSAYNTENNHWTFSISGTGTGTGGIIYHGQNYVNVDNITSAIGLTDNFINSASSGWNALDLINKNSAKWIEGKTYTQGDNINITNQVVSGRDWTPELNTKLDVIVYSTWSAAVEQSAADLSAAIDALPAAKDYDSVSATVYNNSAYWGETYNYVSNFSADFNTWSADINTWSAGVEQSAANMSAYINDNEQYWINSSVNVQTNTPSLLSVDSAYDAVTKTITYTVSAKAGEGTKYEAGDWIDSDELDSGVISVSGYKNLKAQAPLYFEEDDTDPDHIVWIKYDGSDTPVTQKRGVVIVNGFNLGRSSEDNYHNEGGGVECTVVPNNKDGEYTFHFERPMAIQININAKFVAKESMKDSMSEVGFNGVTYEGVSLTNDITFNMLGALGSNYYACSTIARIENVGGSWPEGGIDLNFSFKFDADFIANIENPCISIHEIIGRGDN